LMKSMRKITGGTMSPRSREGSSGGERFSGRGSGEGLRSASPSSEHN
jgi:hypothetical protein